MQITQFEISADRSQIDLTITDAATVSTLRFWTNLTYKDFSEAIDLSTKLTASATENIIITLSDIGESYFDGVYFIEAEDVDEVSSAITADLTRYKECILDKLIQASICEDCLKSKSVSLINAQGILNGLEIAVEQGFIDEILILVNSLDLYCSNECKTCGEYKNVTSNNYYSAT